MHCQAKSLRCPMSTTPDSTATNGLILILICLDPNITVKHTRPRGVISFSFNWCGINQRLCNDGLDLAKLRLTSPTCGVHVVHTAFIALVLHKFSSIFPETCVLMGRPTITTTVTQHELNRGLYFSVGPCAQCLSIIPGLEHQAPLRGR